MKEITKALIKFHMEVGKVKKDADNPFFKSKYASLSNILDVVTPVLVTCDLNIIQMPVGEGKLKTILSHISGEMIESEFDMHVLKRDPQSMGSAITYARRYAIGAILNLNIDEDDDGNKASIPPSANAPQPQSKYPTTADADDKEWLNAVDRDGELTTLGKQVALALHEERRTWVDVRNKYKVSKKDQTAIDNHVEFLRNPKVKAIKDAFDSDDGLPFDNIALDDTPF